MGAQDTAADPEQNLSEDQETAFLMSTPGNSDSRKVSNHFLYKDEFMPHPSYSQTWLHARAILGALKNTNIQTPSQSQ